jgi:hypothetical protein
LGGIYGKDAALHLVKITARVSGYTAVIAKEDYNDALSNGNQAEAQVVSAQTADRFYCTQS